MVNCPELESPKRRKSVQSVSKSSYIRRYATVTSWACFWSPLCVMGHIILSDKEGILFFFFRQTWALRLAWIFVFSSFGEKHKIESASKAALHLHHTKTKWIASRSRQTWWRSLWTLLVPMQAWAGQSQQLHTCIHPAGSAPGPAGRSQLWLHVPSKESPWGASLFLPSAVLNSEHWIKSSAWHFGGYRDVTF